MKEYRVNLTFSEKVKAISEDEAKKIAYDNVKKYVYNGDEENIIVSEITDNK